MTDKTPARSKIIAHLYEAGRALPIHEFQIPGVSPNSIGTRLPELAKEGIVESVAVPGARYKAWRLKSQELALPLSV